MYKIEINSVKKIFFIVYYGICTSEMFTNLFREYDNKIKSINVSEYDFVVDLTDLKAGYQNILGDAKKSMELILNTKFKRHFHIMPKSAVSLSQIKRTGEEFDIINKMIIVNSYEEVCNYDKNN